MAAEVLSAHHLTLKYQKKKIIEALDISFMEKKMTVIIGPNGCGKSTLLKGLGRILDHDGGEIRLNGINLSHLSTKEIAKEIAFLPQGTHSPEDVTVRDVVGIGRYPYQGIFQKRSSQDEAIITDVLSETGLLELSDRNIAFLSGGQRQRVWIAMALAQQTPVILLDEPTTYLDLGHQLEVLNLLQRLNHEKGLTVIMVLHDLNLAARFSDYMIAMKAGKIYYQGKPDDIMTAPILKEIFGIKALIGKDPIDQKPVCLRFD